MNHTFPTTTAVIRVKSTYTDHYQTWVTFAVRHGLELNGTVNTDLNGREASRCVPYEDMNKDG